MTQAVYEQDLKKMGYMDAETKYAPILKEKEAQIAELEEKIAKTEAILKEALEKVDSLE